ncbi:MAG: hypothetical protein M3083_21315 [Actinomycetota bacterium]|nr:hypothetical protein [Actinomycetota bacterium]
MGGGVWGVLTVGHSKASPTRVPPSAASSLSGATPYAARAGPGGTKILTETVDPLILTVPESWMAPAADVRTLPGVLDHFAGQVPALASSLDAQIPVAEKSAIRLFAYQPAVPHAFVSVVSFAAPSAKPLTKSAVDAVVAIDRARVPNAPVSEVDLAVGPALKTDTSVVVQKQPVAIEQLIFNAGGRSILVEMVSETVTGGPPPVFALIAQSLRLS